MTTVVLAHGVFDIIHPGHIAHLQQAKERGDTLVVSITADKYVRKGPGRPVFNEQQRRAVLESLKFVDAVYICDSTDALPAIDSLTPQIYAKGPDYADRTDGTFAREKAAVEKYGGRVAFTSGFTASSSALINGHVRPASPQIVAIREKYGYSGVIGYLDLAAALTMFCAGEFIIDEYITVTPASKSAKENLVVYRKGETNAWPGGIAAVAAHARGLGHPQVDDTVGLLPPITKTRYVDHPFGVKLFAVSNVAESNPPALETWYPYKKAMREAAVTLVVDYGHGMFPYEPNNLIVRAIRSNTKFLALTVQSNSLNMGYNFVTKWPSADYVVVDEPELRLALRRQDGPVDALVQELHERMRARVTAITLGHRGCMVYDGKSFVTMPAMADKVVDRIGAGDAFLAATAGLAAVGAPIDIIALVGNVAGGLQVGVVGNSQPITRKGVERVLRSVLA